MIDWHGFARVLGAPAGMGSKRLGRRRDGTPVIIDNDDLRLRSWQRELKAAMCLTAPDGGPLDLAIAVALRIYVPRPGSHYLRRGLRDDAPRLPKHGRDCDKVLRAVNDCGTGIWWTDDSRVCRGTFERLWAEDGRVRTEVEAWVADAPMPEPPGQTRLELAEVG